MSEKKPAPRKRDRKRDRKPAARHPGDEELRQAAAEKAPFPHQAPPATDTIATNEPTAGDLEAENRRLRALNENLEGELRERRAEDRANAAHAQSFELIKLLATHRHRFESIELRAAPEQIRNRAVPYEATLVVTYSAGTHRFTAVAGDPARALLEALAQFSDQMRTRKVPAVEDLSTLFALIDNQWVITKGSAFLPSHGFALAK